MEIADIELVGGCCWRDLITRTGDDGGVVSSEISVSDPSRCFPCSVSSSSSSEDISMTSAEGGGARALLFVRLDDLAFTALFFRAGPSSSDSMMAS